MKNKLKKVLKWTGIIGGIASGVIGTPIAIYLWIKERKKRKMLEEELYSRTPVKCDYCD